jgi:FkbM family methyltransferase
VKRLKTIYGQLSIPPDTDEDLICRFLGAYGEWGYAEALIASSLVQPGDVLWDIGAYLGTFSLGVSKNKTLGGVLAVEANPLLAEALHANLENNLYQPFRHLTAAVASLPGVGTVITSAQANLGSSLFHMSMSAESARGPRIDGITLNALRAKYGSYDFLKLDIEGMEFDALQGDVEFIRENKPVIWAECNQTYQSLVLLDIMFELGYEPIYVAFPAIRSDNFLKNREFIFAMSYEAVLVCANRHRTPRLSTAAVVDPCIVRLINRRQDLVQALWDTPRWSTQDWAGLSKPELVARIGRNFRSESISSFLNEQPMRASAVVGSKWGTGTHTQAGAPASYQSGSSFFPIEANVVFDYPVSKYDHAHPAELEMISLGAVIDGIVHEICVPIPDAIGEIERIRIEVESVPVVIEVHSINMLSHSGENLWSWHGDVSAIRWLERATAFTGKDSSGLLSVVSLNKSFCMEIDLLPDVKHKVSLGCVLEVKFVPYILLNRLPEVIDELIEIAIPANLQYVYEGLQPKAGSSLGKSLVELEKEVDSTFAALEDKLARQASFSESLRVDLLRINAQYEFLQDLIRNSTGSKVIPQGEFHRKWPDYLESSEQVFKKDG